MGTFPVINSTQNSPHILAIRPGGGGGREERGGSHKNLCGFLQVGEGRGNTKTTVDESGIKCLSMFHLYLQMSLDPALLQKNKT